MPVPAITSNMPEFEIVCVPDDTDPTVIPVPAVTEVNAELLTVTFPLRSVDTLTEPVPTTVLIPVLVIVSVLVPGVAPLTIARLIADPAMNVNESVFDFAVALVAPTVSDLKIN